MKFLFLLAHFYQLFHCTHSKFGCCLVFAFALGLTLFLLLVELLDLSIHLLTLHLSRVDTNGISLRYHKSYYEK